LEIQIYARERRGYRERGYSLAGQSGLAVMLPTRPRNTGRAKSCRGAAKRGEESRGGLRGQKVEHTGLGTRRCLKADLAGYSNDWRRYKRTKEGGMSGNRTTTGTPRQTSAIVLSHCFSVKPKGLLNTYTA